MVLLLSCICTQRECTGARLQIKCSSGRVWVWQQPKKLWSLSTSSLGIVQCVGLKPACYQHTMRQSWWGADNRLFSCSIILTLLRKSELWFLWNFLWFKPCSIVVQALAPGRVTAISLSSPDLRSGGLPPVQLLMAMLELFYHQRQRHAGRCSEVLNVWDHTCPDVFFCFFFLRPVVIFSALARFHLANCTSLTAL